MHRLREDELKRVGIVLQYLLFLRPLFDQYDISITALSVQQTRIPSDYDTHQPSISVIHNLLHGILQFHLTFISYHGKFILHTVHN